MRGPGPKWLEKHSGGIDRIGPVADDHRGDKHSLTGFFFQLCEAGALRPSCLTMNTLAKLLLVLLLFAMWRRQHKDAREATGNFTR
jgi:hypothetical protein